MAKGAPINLFDDFASSSEEEQDQVV